jgi:hypothetical protein
LSVEHKLGDASESITFRIKQDILTALRKECERNGVTLNALVGQVLGRFTSWSNTAARAGFVPVPRQMLMVLLSGLTEEKAADLGRAVAANQASDILLLMRGSVSEDGLIAIFEAWLKESNMPYSKSVRGDTTKIVVQHDLGTVWSVLASTFFQEVYFSVFHKKVRTDYTENSLVLQAES